MALYKLNPPGSLIAGGATNDGLPYGEKRQVASIETIAEEILGEIRWLTPLSGYCRCPGIEHHTNPSGPRDCKVWLDGAPTVYCMHQSCVYEVARTNQLLRSQIGKAHSQYVHKPRSPFRPSYERKSILENCTASRKERMDFQEAVDEQARITTNGLMREGEGYTRAILIASGNKDAIDALYDDIPTEMGKERQRRYRAKRRAKKRLNVTHAIFCGNIFRL